MAPAVRAHSYDVVERVNRSGSRSASSARAACTSCARAACTTCARRWVHTRRLCVRRDSSPTRATGSSPRQATTTKKKGRNDMEETKVASEVVLGQRQQVPPHHLAHAQANDSSLPAIPQLARHQTSGTRSTAPAAPRWGRAAHSLRTPSVLSAASATKKKHPAARAPQRRASRRPHPPRNMRSQPPNAGTAGSPSVCTPPPHPFERTNRCGVPRPVQLRPTVRVRRSPCIRQPPPSPLQPSHAPPHHHPASHRTASHGTPLPLRPPPPSSIHQVLLIKVSRHR